MPDADDIIPVGPIATAGIAATGVGLLFPTAAVTTLLPASVAAGAGMLFPIAAAIGGAIGGWYVGKALFRASPIYQDQGAESPSAAVQPVAMEQGMDPSLGAEKEWAKGEELRGAGTMRER